MAIHLQPPDEMLTSQLRTIKGGDIISTTFAWLGYGTIVQRSRTLEFLSLLEKLNLFQEEQKMADNYFSILSNTIPERWFAPGIELGGGEPFTVGKEGEERNNLHIVGPGEPIHDNTHCLYPISSGLQGYWMKWYPKTASLNYPTYL